VQPRYILPLIVLLGGLLVLEVGRKRFVLGRVQSLAVVVALSGANLVALHTNIRRYVTGADVPDWNLNSNVEWFWSGAPAPMAVWAVGSLAFAGLVAVLVREMSISAARAPEINADERASLSAR
jgi:glutamate mutase epsilon subunit